MQKIEFINITMWDYPITVCRLEEGSIIWCNHAQAEEEEVEHQVNNVDGQDLVWADQVLVCRRCKATRFVGENGWRDAPFEGVHYE